LSSVSLFFIRPVFSKKASSPTKQAEIMSMGIPLICNSGVGDTDLIFADDSAGVVLDGFSEMEFDKAIEKIDSLLQLNPDRIRQKAVKLFNLQDGVDIYDTIYRKINTD
jgi:glycosyltransferase involved in cell wall biosynthesis